MSNIIAVAWDFDGTLIHGNMQDPMFEEYHIKSDDFWKEKDELSKYYFEKQGVTVNPDTAYLNLFIKYARDGRFPGLCNKKLRELGKEQHFYQGIPEIFDAMRKVLDEKAIYKEYGIVLEHYLISTGFAETVKGSKIAQYMKHIWGCELTEEPDKDGNPILDQIAYTIDNTTKTRAIFEINKGVPFSDVITVNSSVPEENRRVQLKNMIYVADGPSDIPAFSVVKKGGGSTFAVYPHGDTDAIQQSETMRENGRVDMYAEADYSENSTAYLWLTNKVREIANRIVSEGNAKAMAGVSSAPKHLNN